MSKRVHQRETCDKPSNNDDDEDGEVTYVPKRARTEKTLVSKRGCGANNLQKELAKRVEELPKPEPSHPQADQSAAASSKQPVAGPLVKKDVQQRDYELRGRMLMEINLDSGKMHRIRPLGPHERPRQRKPKT